MPIPKPWNGVFETWLLSDLSIRPGVSEDAISVFESKHNVVLPADVRAFFLLADGTGDDMDSHLYRFWPLNEVKLVEDELSDSRHDTAYGDRLAYPNCFIFADYCIWCWAYALKLTTDPDQPAPVYRVTGGEEPGEQMASSFIEFMTKYSINPDDII